MNEAFSEMINKPVLVVAMTAVMVTMVMALIRAAKGPTVFDRILAANMFGTKTVLIIAVSGFYNGRPDWLDLAILYALMNFIGTIAVLKYARFGNLAMSKRAPGNEVES